MNRRRLSRSRRAVSEVIGALLLILIVVIAVASLAYFLSTVQTQSQNRQLYLDDVADEKLQISNLQFSLNNSLIQYEIYNSLNNTKYYVQMINNTMVDLINETSGSLYHSANLNASNTNPVLPFIPAFYNSINSSTTASIYTQAGGSVAPLWNITFEPSNTGAWAFRTATWSNATITVRNLNIQTSGIKAVEVNGNFLNNNVTLLNSNDQQPYNLTVLPIEIPEKQSVNIVLNLTYLNIPRTSPMQIVLASSAGNFFTTSYAPPSAVIQESVSSENYLITSRDVPMFSGSDSTGSNGSFIQQYIWQIDVPESTTQPGWTWSSVGSLDTTFAYGQSFQFRPESFFTSPQLVGSTNTTLVDSSAHFTSAQVGEYLTYMSGPAIYETEPITGTDHSTTTLTTAPFSSVPDTSGDEYMVTTTEPVTTGMTTSGTTSTTLTDANVVFTSAQYGEYLTYVSGPAAGETQMITGYSQNTLTTTGAFTPAPDASGDTFIVTATVPTSPIIVASGTTNTVTITGPFRVTLTTVDQYGFMTTSQFTVFSSDPNIAPAGSFSATESSVSGSCDMTGDATVSVTVNNIFGQPAANVPVVFLGATSGVIPATSFAVTGSDGQVSIGVTCPMTGPTSGTLEIESGNLPAYYLSLT